MRVNSRFTRFALAMGVVGVISSQVPQAGGVAMAYTPGGGGGGRGLVTGLVLGLVGIGVYSTLSDKTPVPPAPADTSVPTTNAPVPATTTTPVFDAANTNADLSTFASDADKAGLKDQLEKQPGPYTVFAPTNAAFASLPGDQLASLAADATKMKALLSFHIVQGKYTMQDLRNLADGTQLPTLSGSPVTITKQGTNVLVNGVQVIDNDIPASNGVIHPLGSVLTPPAS